MEATDRILFVDDEPAIRRALERLAKNNRLTADVAADATSALALAKDRSYAVVAVDYVMPGVDGLTLVEQLRPYQPDASYMLISGNADLGTTLEAVNEHSIAYVIPKPWNNEQLLTHVNRALESSWERGVARRMAASRVDAAHRWHARETLLKGELEESQKCLALALLASLKLRDGDTEDACRRVATYARFLAGLLGHRGIELDNIENGALLHDVGKIGIADAILLKPGPLTEAEWRIMRGHAQAGADLLQEIPPLRGAAQIVGQHHERWDGSGYPKGLSGEAICIGARILAVVDAFDAMLSDRPYRKGASYEVARDELIRCAGTQFDANIVKAFLTVPKEKWLELRTGLLAA